MPSLSHRFSQRTRPSFVSFNITSCNSGMSNRHFFQLHDTPLPSSLFKTNSNAWSCPNWLPPISTSYRYVTAFIATARLVSRMRWPFSGVTLTQIDDTLPFDTSSCLGLWSSSEYCTICVSFSIRLTLKKVLRLCRHSHVMLCKLYILHSVFTMLQTRRTCICYQ